MRLCPKVALQFQTEICCSRCCCSCQIQSVTYVHQSLPPLSQFPAATLSSLPSSRSPFLLCFDCCNMRSICHRSNRGLKIDHVVRCSCVQLQYKNEHKMKKINFSLLSFFVIINVSIVVVVVVGLTFYLFCELVYIPYHPLHRLSLIKHLVRENNI